MGKPQIMKIFRMKRKTCKQNCYETYKHIFLKGIFMFGKRKTLYFQKTDDTLGDFLKKIRKN